jgi:hypothetical protein
MREAVSEGEWRLSSDDDLVLIGFSLFYLFVLALFFGVFVWEVLL